MVENHLPSFIFFFKNKSVKSKLCGGCMRLNLNFHVVKDSLSCTAIDLVATRFVPIYLACLLSFSRWPSVIVEKPVRYSPHMYLTLILVTLLE